MRKNILVLGGNGFIGKNLTDELINDFNIISFGLKKNSDGNSKIKSYYGDFTSIKDLEIIFKENKIDLVFHLISTTVPSNSNDDVVYDINSNLISTINLLELMRKYTVPKIIYISSGGTIYGKIDSDVKNVSENHKTNPISSYGIVKLSIEKYLHLYKHLYNIDFLILRLSNPYGGHHISATQGLINIILRKILQKEAVTVWGDGTVVRDYIYIKDCVKIIRKLLDINAYNKVVNVGSGIGYSINEILELIEKNIGKFTIIRNKNRNFDVPKIVLNIDMLRSLIDFKLTDIDQGIISTYKWQKNNQNNSKNSFRQ